MSQEYYSVLARTMTAVTRDHAQLRMMIYRFARSELRRELYERRDIRWAEIKQQISALEKAIEQIESDVIDDTMLLTFSSERVTNQKAAARSTNTALVVHQNSAELAVPDDGESDVLPPVAYASPYPAEHNWRLPSSSAVKSRFDPIQPKPIRKAFGSTLQLVAAAVLGVALYTAVEKHGDLVSLITRYGRDDVVKGRQIADGHPGQNAMEGAGNPPNSLPGNKEPGFEPEPSVGPRIAGVLIPSAYGVYAVVHGQLTDLQSLPIRVPDQRVAISALISTPSGSTLPDGRLQFIAYKRDLTNKAPDRVPVRIVARVMRALTFDAAGKARMVNVEGLWAVRSNAYEMKVAPVSGIQEMVVIRPEDPDFSFPAGRYALVLNGSAYDFSVDGPITDTAQCLERTDALNAPVYTECRNP